MGTAEQLRTFIHESFFVDSFEEDESFLRSGIVDSMGMLQVVSFVEHTFGFKVRDDELVPANFDTLRDLVRFIESKRQRPDQAQGKSRSA